MTRRKKICIGITINSDSDCDEIGNVSNGPLDEEQLGDQLEMQNSAGWEPVNEEINQNDSGDVERYSS